MAEGVRVSVIMPVYNGERFIAEAVGSVLANSFTDFELVVLDDGSTDGSADAAARAARGDGRVQIVRCAHAGIGATRNAGLELARGEFIANLDSDDAMFPNRLAKQVAYLDRHAECVAVSARSVVVDDESRPIGMVGRYFTHQDIDRFLLDGHGGAIGGDSAMLRRDAVRSVGGYAARLASTGEDHDLWLRLAEIGRLACPPWVLNRYRVHQRNVSVGKRSRERRLPVTLDTLQRAFERRGIADRIPAKIPSPPLRAGEKRRDRALLRYYSGDRRGAAVDALVLLARHPRTPGMAESLRIIASGPAPQWPHS